MIWLAIQSHPATEFQNYLNARLACDATFSAIISPMNDAPNKLTVLLVDDAPENIEVLTLLLRDAYRLQSAPNGAKAISIATSDDPPDLILLTS